MLYGLRSSHREIKGHIDGALIQITKLCASEDMMRCSPTFCFQTTREC